MPSQRDIKRRIDSVRNTRKITRAMELVASARLRRAQERIEALRPYAQAMRRLMAQAARQSGSLTGMPLLEERDDLLHLPRRLHHQLRPTQQLVGARRRIRCVAGRRIAKSRQ